MAVAGRGAGAEPLTIGALELVSGVSRGTIYYYLRSGLLPPAQKASATRSFYDRSHVELLGEIKRLQAEGLSLQQIRERLGRRIEAAAETGVDLVAKQNGEMRKTILEAAARRFAERGYDRTRIIDICEEVGVTTQVLYSHFPSKHRLFIACYDVYFRWMRDHIESHMQEAVDPTARLAWRVYAAYGIQALSPDLQALARLETIHERSDLRDLLRETYAQMLADVGEDLAAVRGRGAAREAVAGDRDAESHGAVAESGAGPSLFDDELVAYALLGALDNMQMRAAWDSKYDRLDVMRNLLVIHLAIRAVYAGEVDLTDRWAAVAELAARLAGAPPFRSAASTGT